MDTKNVVPAVIVSHRPDGLAEQWGGCLTTDAIPVPGGLLFRTWAPKVGSVGVATTFVPCGAVAAAEYLARLPTAECGRSETAGPKSGPA
ncbi:hypothetical protein [Azospirillum sp. sgz302134]